VETFSGSLVTAMCALNSDGFRLDVTNHRVGLGDIRNSVRSNREVARTTVSSRGAGTTVIGL
jgi:hypothetical protein